MIAQGQQVLSATPEQALIPSAFLFATVVSLNVLGDALRERWWRPMNMNRGEQRAAAGGRGPQGELPGPPRRVARRQRDELFAYYPQQTLASSASPDRERP